jgi:hypothetical protein
MMGHVVSMVDVRNLFKILIGKFGKYRPLGIPEYRSEENIQICYKEIGWEDVNWIRLAQDSYGELL